MLKHQLSISDRFSVNKEGTGSYGSFYLLIDEKQYAFKDAYFGDSDIIASGSATINVKLTAGQVVGIENFGSTLIYGTDSAGYMYSWFTGHLLYAL